jgi:predicted nuclease of predicted toxin-antitoxin system
MRIYLDDNFADRALAATLRKSGHQVSRPADFGLLGASDARHLERAIRENLVLLTKDRDDFQELHDLVLTSGGQHPGMPIVRYENDAKRDMRRGHVIAALGKLERAGTPLQSERTILNQWR